MYKVMAYVHSDKETYGSYQEKREVELVSRNSDNDIIFNVDGVLCKGIYNPFNNSYYADNKYGICSGE